MLVPLSPHFVLCYLFNYPLRVVAKVQLPHPLLWSAKSNCPLTPFLHHGAGFRLTNSGLITVRNIVFVSDKHTLVFQPSLTLYVLPLVTESTISHSFHYPCDNNHGVSLHLKFSNVSDQVLVVSLFSASL